MPFDVHARCVTVANMKKSCRLFSFVLCLFLFTSSTSLAKSTFIRSGDVAAYGLPVVAGLVTLFKQDWDGTKQFGADMGAYVALQEGLLKNVVQERRPTGNAKDSFPSGHAAAAFTSALFLQRRYGMRYGIPALLTASYVGFVRIHADKHHFHDVFGSFVFSLATVLVFTKPYKNKNFTVSVTPEVGGKMTGLTLTAKTL